jgi:hypothetical protein
LVKRVGTRNSSVSKSPIWAQGDESVIRMMKCVNNQAGLAIPSECHIWFTIRRQARARALRNTAKACVGPSASGVLDGIPSLTPHLARVWRRVLSHRKQTERRRCVDCTSSMNATIARLWCVDNAIVSVWLGFVVYGERVDWESFLFHCCYTHYIQVLLWCCLFLYCCPLTSEKVKNDTRIYHLCDGLSSPTSSAPRADLFQKSSRPLQETTYRGLTPVHWTKCTINLTDEPNPSLPNTYPTKIHFWWIVYDNQALP